MDTFSSVRNDFPLLRQKINGTRIVYLDSTATALKPRQVIDAVDGYYTSYTSNVFRGIYKISEKATSAYEDARSKVAEFIGGSPEEIVFTRNATESINLVYYSWALEHIHAGDEIVTTILEHHSNFVPWQQLSLNNNATLRIWNAGSDGLMDMSGLEKLVNKKTKLVALTSMSNVYGTVIDIKKVVGIVKRINPACVVLVDAAQSVPHMKVNVHVWGADFVAFSGHKMMGPTGIGVLWGKKEILDAMPPYQYGGDMISEVHVQNSHWKESPHKFEAGTPHIAGVIGLGAAVDYLNSIGMEKVREHEIDITAYALSQVSRIKKIHILGPKSAQDKGGVVAFTMEGVHPHDIAQILDEDNICIRVGFHCAQPLHEYAGCGPTARASFYVYTTKEDIDMLVSALEKVQKIFK